MKIYSFFLELAIFLSLIVETIRALNGTSCTWEKPFPNLILTENESLSLQLSDYLKCGVQVQYKLFQNNSSPLKYDLSDSLENLMHSYFISPQIMTKSILKYYNNMIFLLHNTSYTVMTFKLDPLVAIKISSINQESLKFNFELMWQNYNKGITQKRVDSQDLIHYAGTKYSINCSYFFNLNEKDGIILDCELIGTEKPKPPQLFLNYVLNTKKNGFLFYTYQFLQESEMLGCGFKRMRFEPQSNILLRFCQEPDVKESVIQVWEKYEENAFFLFSKKQTLPDNMKGPVGVEFYKTQNIVLLHFQGLSLLDMDFNQLDNMAFNNKNDTAIMHTIAQNTEDNKDVEQMFSVYTNSTITMLSIEEKHLSNSSVTLNFNLTKFIDLEDSETPIEMFFTPRYLALNYEGSLKVLMPEGSWFDSFTTSLPYEKLSYALDSGREHMFLRFFQDSMEDNIIIISRDRDSHPYSWSDNTYRWLLNVTQVIKRTIRLGCCSIKENQTLKSMQNMPFSIKLFNNSVQIQSITISVYFWDLDEKNVFYAPQTNNDAGLSMENSFAFDTERIYIALWGFILGPLAEPSIQLAKPYMRDISVKGLVKKKLNGLKGKIVEQLSTLEDLRNLKQYLKLTLLNYGLECFWQNKQTKKIRKITCQGQDSSKNYDCILDYEKELETLVINVIGPVLDYYLILNEDKSMAVLHQIDTITKDYDYYKTTETDLRCDDIYIIKRKLILLCFLEKQVFRAFKMMVPGQGIQTPVKFQTIGWTKKLQQLFNISAQSIKKVHYELADLSCLLVLTTDQLLFFELLISEEEDDKTASASIDIELKNNITLDDEYVESYVMTLSETQRRLILVYTWTSKILEYNLDRNPFMPIFSRPYPMYGHYIHDSYLNGKNCLVISCTSDDLFYSYEFVFNVQNPTASLLTNRLEQTFDNLYGRLSYVDNYLANINGRGVFIQWDSNPDEIYLFEYGGFELIGTVPIVQEKNDKFYQYEVHLNYNNSLANRHVVQSLKINITLNDTVLNLKQNGRFFNSAIVRAFENNEFCGKVANDDGQLRIVLNDDLFSGPVQAYYMKYYVKGEEIKTRKRYDTVPFMILTSYFVEYQDVLEKYGKLVQMEKFDNILVLLTARTLTFLVNDEDIKELASLTLDNPCELIKKHNNQSRMILLCQNGNSDYDDYYLLHVEFTLNISENGSEYNFNYRNHTISISDNTISFIYHVYFMDSLVLLVIRRMKTEDEITYMIFYLSYEEKIGYELVPIKTISHQYTPSEKTLYSLELFHIDSNETDYLYGALQMINSKIYVFAMKISKSLTKQISKSNSTLKIDLEDLKIGVIDPLIFLPNIILGRVKLAIKTISLIAFEKDGLNINLKVLLTTNVHIYHCAIYISNLTVINKVDIIHTYRKYYGCENKVGLRPILYEGFLGSFCDKVSTPNSDSLNTVTYFVLHKTLPDHESSPIRAMQILIDIYQFMFIGLQKSVIEKSINVPFSCTGCFRLLLPSYFNIFTQYLVTPNLTIFQKSFPNANEQNDDSIKLIITAFNDVSNVSITIDLSPPTVDSFNRTIGIVLGVISAVVILCLLVGSIIYSRMTKNDKKLEEMMKNRHDEDEYNNQKHYYASQLESTSVDDWYKNHNF